MKNFQCQVWPEGAVRQLHTRVDGLHGREAIAGAQTSSRVSKIFV